MSTTGDQRPRVRAPSATIGLLRSPAWVRAGGYLIYVGALAAGYYYNLTFVQLGLVDLGRRVIGMSHREVSVTMAVLASAALVVAVVVGIVMDRRRWGADLRVKLRLLVLIVGAQLVLTVVAPYLRTPVDCSPGCWRARSRSVAGSP